MAWFIFQKNCFTIEKKRLNFSILSALSISILSEIKKMEDTGLKLCTDKSILTVIGLFGLIVIMNVSPAEYVYYF